MSTKMNKDDWTHALTVFRVWTPRRMQGLSLGESMWSVAFVCPAS